jgi:hypothetical protein
VAYAGKSESIVRHKQPQGVGVGVGVKDGVTVIDGVTELVGVIDGVLLGVIDGVTELVGVTDGVTEVLGVGVGVGVGQAHSGCSQIFETTCEELVTNLVGGPSHSIPVYRRHSEPLSTVINPSFENVENIIDDSTPTQT